MEPYGRNPSILVCAVTHIPGGAGGAKSLICMCDSAHTIILLLLTLTLSKDLAVC